MRIAVIGATGRTGRRVVAQARGRGHAVTAVARHADGLASTVGPETEGLRLIAADAREAAAVGEALSGADAVVSTLGIGASRAATSLSSQGTENIVSAMAHQRISRLVVVSAVPAGPRVEQPFLQRRIALPLLELAFGGTYADMRLMEAALADGPTDWIALRPPRLVDRPGTGRYRLGVTMPPGGRRITCADLATAALDLLDPEQPARRALYVTG